MTVKIGFIGVGGIASVHLQNVSQIEEAQIVAVCDIDQNRAEEVGRKYEAKAYTDHQDMMDHEKLDAVYVCIPPFAHGDVELAVIERNLPMLVEKPLSIEREPAETIVKAVSQQQLMTGVGYNWRYSEASNWAKEILENHKPGMAQGYWLGGMPMVPWWRKMDGSGGQMVEQTTHIVDLSRYLLGEVVQVYAAYAQREMQDVVEGTTVPDVGTMVLKFESGTIATISNTCLLNQGYTVGLDILARETILEVRNGHLTERRNKETIERHNSLNPYLEEDKAFIKAVQTGDRTLIRSNYEDAYRTHLVTVAANESAKTGQPIDLQSLYPVL
ncbi:putative dehydrogenase [Pullulanibacillus pueri]|uniref:Gfo/Idh/MocA family oxidoreductase n=1 Tax=Pullulanibacillus pueri TaxID=1437324 RepID=A0A8J2ZVL1_9BACL|nr:Gfo/Idh/MocA family oxidoreductase [Pullulanibacillus pueri]MBM7682384.1 putative dehydrogenase [Pullulanibacillus pueri]GGH81853.1 hypothetical protein GCM10007096_20370 [Pullulanibacillus pueri]